MRKAVVSFQFSVSDGKVFAVRVKGVIGLRRAILADELCLVVLN
ncbi:MAG: hypothetical protein ABSG51_05080 [Terracidiphilus sp.]